MEIILEYFATDCDTNGTDVSANRTFASAPFRLANVALTTILFDETGATIC